MPVRTLSFTAAIFLCALSVHAQENQPARGRLPDGRAFRTDVEGNQLVDYIAELEVGIETLNRQLESAQEELRDKETALTICKAGVKEGLKEKSLPVPGFVPGNLAPASSVPTQSCDPQNARIAQAESEIRTLRDDRDIIATKLGDQLKDCREELAENSTRASARLGAAENSAEKERKAEFVVDTVSDPVKTDPRPVIAVPKLIGAETAASKAEQPSLDTPAAVRIEPNPAKMRGLDALRGKVYTQLNQVKNSAMKCGREKGSSECGQALLTIETLRRKALEAQDPSELSGVTSEIQSVRQLVSQAMRE